MIEDINNKKKFASEWFIYLQKEICNQFQDLESQMSKKNKKTKSLKKRVVQKWGSKVEVLLFF